MVCSRMSGKRWSDGDGSLELTLRQLAPIDHRFDDLVHEKTGEKVRDVRKLARERL